MLLKGRKMEEFPLKKIKALVILCICIGLIESVLGFATLYTGFLYKEFDTKNATEMLEVIKNTDINYYEKIVDPGNIEYMSEFKRVYTTARNETLMVYGIVIISFSICGLIPVSLILISISGAGKDKSKEDELPKILEEEVKKV